MVRNFYGVIRTREYNEPAPYRTMYHGGIKHGGQLWEQDARRLASSYFGPTSGHGRLFASLADDGPRTLAPDGAIVFQATNRYIDIVSVVEKLAAEHGMRAVLVSDFVGEGSGSEYWLAPTDQVIVTRNRAISNAPALRGAAELIEPTPDAPLFTDDSSNLLRILK